MKNFNIQYVIKELRGAGGVSIPLLSEKHRLLLVSEAEKYSYVKQPEIVGSAKVREELSSVRRIPKESLFHKLKENFTELISYKLLQSNLKPFSGPVLFNDLSLQKYDKGSIGITPHLDNLSRINLICIFLLKGRGDFAICSDRQGNKANYLKTTPGNVILLRAPGFFGSNKRPFHFVTNITQERITFGLRQKITKSKLKP